jgi:uridylate kinase
VTGPSELTTAEPAPGAGSVVPRWKRILLKLSGEALMGEQKYGIDPNVVASIADEVRDVHALGVEIAVVIGGGNIIRGVSAAASGIDRVAGDHMGMLATVINGLAMQDCLEKRGVPTRLVSAIEMRAIAEPFIRRRAIRHLEKGRVVVFAAGTGNPFFTTDSAAALRGIEIHADVIMKATKVDGIYTSDPMKDPDAQHMARVSYRTVIGKGLKVMDTAAISLCEENRIPILVFNLLKKGNVLRAVTGEQIGSVVEP